MVQQRSDRRDDLRLSRGDADHHLLRTVEVRINRLFPLYVFHFARSFSPSLFFSSPFFFFFFLFFPFSSYSLNSFQFFAIRRRRKKKGWREKREFVKSRYSSATQARDRSRPQARVHSFNFANAISLPPSHDNRHSFVIVQLQTIHDAVTQY